LGCDHVFLVAHGLSGHEIALLENNCCISKDEVNGTSNVGVTVKLPVGVCIESVLKCIDFAAVDDGLISADTKSNCLVLLWACRVLEPNVLSYEPISNSSYKTKLYMNKNHYVMEKW
jgi:hypothetical protein